MFLHIDFLHICICDLHMYIHTIYLTTYSDVLTSAAYTRSDMTITNHVRAVCGIHLWLRTSIFARSQRLTHTQIFA